VNATTRAVEGVKRVVDPIVAKYPTAKITVTFDSHDGCDDIEAPVKWNVACELYFEDGKPVAPALTLEEEPGSESR